MKIPRSFYFLRHGQTVDNMNGLLSGQGSNPPLSKTGEFQAKEAGLKLLSLGVEIELIATSPLHRATQTAEIVAGILKQPIQVIEEFQEWDLGEWEGQPLNSLESKFWGSDDPPGGETRLALKERLTRGFHKLNPNTSVLIVSHGGVWLTLRRLLKLPPIKMPNCLPHIIKPNGDSQWTAEPI